MADGPNDIYVILDGSFSPIEGATFRSVAEARLSIVVDELEEHRGPCSVCRYTAAEMFPAVTPPASGQEGSE